MAKTFDLSANDSVKVYGTVACNATATGTASSDTNGISIADLNTKINTLAGKADVGHTHTDRYYTTTQINTNFAKSSSNQTNVKYSKQRIKTDSTDGYMCQATSYGLNAVSMGTIPTGYRPLHDVSIPSTVYIGSNYYPGYTVLHTDGTIYTRYCSAYGGETVIPSGTVKVYFNAQYQGA